jgi:hypothetical protein
MNHRATSAEFPGKALAQAWLICLCWLPASVWSGAPLVAAGGNSSFAIDSDGRLHA